MRILITGATGYIGNQLAIKLADEGNMVHLLCRSIPDKKLSSQPNIKIYMGVIDDKDDIRNAMQGCEQVYHLAAYARVWAKDPRVYYLTNVVGTKNMVQCAKYYKVKKFVFTSTGGVFGPSNGALINENSKNAQPFPNEYASSKYNAEKVVLSACENGLNAVIVNPTRVYGPGLNSKSNAVTALLESYIEGRLHFIPGDGELEANYAFIDDVIDGHIAAMQSGRKGERYILGGENASYNRLFEIIKTQSGLNYPLLGIPFPVIKILSFLDVLSARLINRSPSISPSWVNGMKFDALRSSEKAVRKLGYSITPLDKGIVQTIQFLIQNKKRF